MSEEHCQICGISIKEDNQVRRFGKHFCNEEHAKQFLDQKEDEEKLRTEYVQQNPIGHGGCC